jgi:E3 ubiquitin-protein ligase SHPRH
MNITDTVERNILDLAARQGQSLYTKDNSAGTLQVSSFALGTEKQPAKTLKKTKVEKGDFIFKCLTILSILFCLAGY